MDGMSQVNVYSLLHPNIVSCYLPVVEDWVETSVLFDNDICPTISASGVSLSIIMSYLVRGAAVWLHLPSPYAVPSYSPPHRT